MGGPMVDLNAAFAVERVDAMVQTFYSATNPVERSQAEAVLKQLQEHPDAWTKVDSILEKSSIEQTRFFALQILENVIKFRWGALPDEQRAGIRNYISNLIIKISGDDATFRSQKVFLNKLNMALVQVLKQDWPSKWPSFVPDICGAARTTESLCENSVIILKLLSEEVFDFSRGEMTQAKIKELKSSLNDNFQLIHELCLWVLGVSQKPDLIRATLSTLHAYLSWVPVGAIFSSNVVEQLLLRFPVQAYRNVALQCLTEVAGLQVEDFNSQFQQLYMVFLQQLQQVLPPNVKEAYEKGTDDEQAFVQNLALFFTAFFKAHLGALEASKEGQQAALAGLGHLVDISFVDSDEVFKITLDYWNFFVPDVYSRMQQEYGNANPMHFAFGGAQAGGASGKDMYAQVLSRLRLLMITRMAKPEEVIVVEDEDGNIVRETMKDTDTLARYKTMHETLVYLCNLDHDDTEHQMLDKLKLQSEEVIADALGDLMPPSSLHAPSQLPLSPARAGKAGRELSGKEWSWTGLNTLCWAIGSISGSMQEEQENRFLVTVIRDLLNLCEITRGKDNKAVIASNIMYVVGQYPRFLRNHWKFLKTVVNKLFEFMHETHPGVQDMACETFLKICRRCKKRFIVLQVGEAEPFIAELLGNLTNTIQDLENHQIHMFYEAVGMMIEAEHQDHKRREYLSRLMLPPNTTWAEAIGRARQDPNVLRDPAVIRNVHNVLQTNVSVCSSLGPPFIAQLGNIFTDMLAVYKMYSELISQAVATGGRHASKTSAVKMMRAVKKTTLKLIETFVACATNLQQVADELVPPMGDPILGDYARNVPEARDAEVLSLYAAIISKLGQRMEKEVPQIFVAVFQCTLDMIKQNFEDFPEHRLQFFSLLRAITTNCFSVLFAMSEDELRQVMNSIVWAFRHTERNVAETGLNLLLEMLERFAGSEFATRFHQAYYLQLMQEIFAVMTDSFHKPGFKLHVRILHHLFSIVNRGVIKAPLWDVAAKGAAAYPSNAAFVQEYVSSLLATSFGNLRPQQIQACVSGMMTLQDLSSFKEHLRDFLVQTKSFSSQDNADLFAEETLQRQEAERQQMAAIPGMLHPHEAGTDQMAAD